MLKKRNTCTKQCFSARPSPSSWWEHGSKHLEKSCPKDLPCLFCFILVFEPNGRPWFFIAAADSQQYYMNDPACRPFGSSYAKDSASPRSLRQVLGENMVPRTINPSQYCKDCQRISPFFVFVFASHGRSWFYHTVTMNAKYIVPIPFGIPSSKYIVRPQRWPLLGFLC